MYVMENLEEITLYLNATEAILRHNENIIRNYDG